MPRPRFERLDADKRDVILDAAEQEFAAHGFARASYNRIIEQAGVSKGAMYYYFDDKADLYRTVVRRSMVGVIEAMGEIDEVDSAEAYWGQWDVLLGRATVYLTADPERAERTRGLVRSLAEAPPGMHEVMAVAQQPAEEFLKVGQRAGAVRDDLPIGLLATMTLALGEAMDTWMATHWEELPPGSYGSIMGKLMCVFRRLCEPPGG